jgi:hypothetical protein
LEALREVAPHVTFTVDREEDPHDRWNEKEWGEQGNFTSYDYDFSARVIERGKIVEGQAHLGSCWNDGPIDTDCNGYLPQKLEEAAEELRALCKDMLHHNELDAAIILLTQELETRYAEQMSEKQSK